MTSTSLWAAFSLDGFLIAVRRARFNIRWRGLSFRGNDIPLDRLDANCKVNYDIPVNPFDITAWKGTSVLLSSLLSVALLAPRFVDTGIGKLSYACS